MKSQVQASIGFLAAVLVVLVVVLWRSSGPVAAAATLLIGGTVVTFFGRHSLRRGKHTEWTQAEAAIAPDHAVVLWKPGCPYCERLLSALGDDPRITYVNVWEDEAANARVRELNDGNEYVPTVLIGDQVLRNPGAPEVLGRLA